MGDSRLNSRIAIQEAHLELDHRDSLQARPAAQEQQAEKGVCYPSLVASTQLTCPLFVLMYSAHLARLNNHSFHHLLMALRDLWH